MVAVIHSPFCSREMKKSLWNNNETVLKNFSSSLHCLTKCTILQPLIKPSFTWKIFLFLISNCFKSLFSLLYNCLLNDYISQYLHSLTVQNWVVTLNKHWLLLFLNVILFLNTNVQLINQCIPKHTLDEGSLSTELVLQFIPNIPVRQISNIFPIMSLSKMFTSFILNI